MSDMMHTIIAVNSHASVTTLSVLFCFGFDVNKLSEAEAKEIYSNFLLTILPAL
jgi:hypothetical protein